MGCDGGTIPRRDELVKVKKKPEAKDKDFELAFQWRCCHLSQQILHHPIVMCGLGYLYNKIALIEGLLNRETLPDGVRHIKSLKDVKNLNLTSNPEFKSDDNKKEGGLDCRAAPYICPVTGIEMTGKYRFIGLWSCGCVFSERALKEISTKICHKCQAPFVSDDVVVLNGTEEDIILMRHNMENRQQQNKKKKDKRIKIETETSESNGTIATSNNSKPVEQITESKPSTSTTPAPKPVNFAIGGQLPIKRPGTSDALKNRVKKVKQDYSVAKDPQASDVYKSLFTSHQSEQQQNRAHWITYNPFYN